jgi:hypothetical protein
MARGLLTEGIVRLLAALLLCCALAGAAHANEVDDRAAKVTALEQQLGRVGAERRALAQTYDDRAAAIASLKAQPSAWGRDRKLQALLAESKDMAAALDRKDAELRAIAAGEVAEKQALVAAIDAELAQGPAAERAAYLAQARAAAEPRTPRPIKLADDRIDPADDAQDLEYKAGALAQSEDALLVEERRLALRATYFRKQAKLTKSRLRADEQDVFREEDARAAGRNPAHGSSAKSGGQTDTTNGTPSTATGPPGSSTGPTTPPGSGSTSFTGDARSLDLAADPSVILADVVASGTLDELRKAERSGDPESMARAAERATREVEQRAAALRQRRLEMERRAQELRGAPTKP